MKLISSLDQLKEEDALSYGSKFSTLAQLSKHGILVPFAVGISSHVYRQQVDKIVMHLQPPDWSVLEAQQEYALAERIQQTILAQAKVGNLLLNEIREVLTTKTQRESFRYAVRSSATAEDMPSASFAGQMESYLGVALENLEEYVVRCWASLWLRKAVDYRRRKGVAHTDVGMGVIIQQMVDPDAAGILFTHDPSKFDEPAIRIEAVRGLGMALVQGEADPDKYRLTEKESSKLTIDSFELGKQNSYQWLDQESGEIKELPYKTKTPILSNDKIIELASTGLYIAKLLGTPQDIEWTVCRDQIYILQARPITTLKNNNIESQSPVAQWIHHNHIIRISSGNEELIPSEIAKKDKVRLRLICDQHDLNMSPGWLIHVTEDMQHINDEIPDEMTTCDQVSMVLQDPPRLSGEICRQFTKGSTLHESMVNFIQRVKSAYSTFTFIVTEIYHPRLSGISKVVGNNIVTEVAFGSYIPKGIASTSLFVMTQNGEISTSRVVWQEEAVYIVDGSPEKVTINQQPVLSLEQLKELYRITSVIQSYYPNTSVEYGTNDKDQVYLIDIIQETIPDTLSLDNTNIMSPGKITGKAMRVIDEQMLWTSLDAHFHSQRIRSSEATKTDNTIIVAGMPYLSLEGFIINSSHNLGFVFQKGSILGHLAIILREYGIPAVISPEMFDSINDEDLVTIDSSQILDNIVHIHHTPISKE